MINQQVLPMHQSAEWGVKALEDSFFTVYDQFMYEGEKRIISMMIMLFYNFMAHGVGIN